MGGLGCIRAGQVAQGFEIEDMSRMEAMTAVSRCSIN